MVKPPPTGINQAERHTFTETIYLPERKGEILKRQKASSVRQHRIRKGESTAKSDQPVTVEEETCSSNAPPSKGTNPKNQPKAAKPQTTQGTRTSPRHLLSEEDRKQTKRELDRTRNQTPERKAFLRLQQQKLRENRKALGQCRNCPQKAIPGQVRCEACRDKHQADNRRRNAEHKSKNRQPSGTPDRT